MRVFMTSFAALLALVAFGPGITGTALGDDTGANAGTSGGPAGMAGAPALPPVPVPASAPTLAPIPPPVPTPTFAPGPVLRRTPAGQALGNPGMTQTPGEGPNAGVAANPSGDQWRFRWHNNNWWYWTPENRWVYRNGNEWTNYEPAVTAVPDIRYSSQPAFGYYQSSPNGYYPAPYRYSTGYGGYYAPAYQGGYYGPVYQGGYSYGPGGYYGRPGVSVGVGFGRGLRIGF